jgi:hypothetical protein
MAIAAFILMGVSVFIAMSMIAAGIELNRRSYRERMTLEAPSTLARLPEPAAEDGGPGELQQAA